MSGDTLFCFGMGYSAQCLAWRLLAKGWRVIGTTRSVEGAKVLRERGIIPVIYTVRGEGADIADHLSQSTHVLASIPPDNEGDPAVRDHGPDIRQAGPHLAWIGYLSTIGVYGDHQGDWIDESAPLTPAAKRAEWRVVAERQWLDLGAAADIATHIFRLPGIYGPGRNQLMAVKEGRARRLVKPGQVFNRIHVEDIASVLEASIGKPNGGAVYNVTDDEPAPPQDVVAYAAELLGVTPPPEQAFERAKLSPMAKSFYGECKRVRNDRIKAELGITLTYPTYREGLRGILQEMQMV